MRKNILIKFFLFGRKFVKNINPIPRSPRSQLILRRGGGGG